MAETKKSPTGGAGKSGSGITLKAAPKKDDKAPKSADLKIGPAPAEKAEDKPTADKKDMAAVAAPAIMKLGLKKDTPATPPAEAPASAEPATEAAKEKPKTFQNFFGKKKAEEKESKVITSVLKKGAAPKVKPILGAAPALQRSIEEEKILKLKSKLRTAQIVFLIVFVLSLGTFGYFYSQISPSFDGNPTNTLKDVNINLRSAQTTLNKYRYLAAQLDLNTFSFVSDEFLDKTSQLTTKQLSTAAVSAITDSVNKSSDNIPSLLGVVKENLTPDIVIQTVRSEAEEETTDELVKAQFETDLRNALMEDRKLLSQSETLSAETAHDLRLIDNTIKLVGNEKLLGTIRATSLENFTKDLQSYTDTLDPVQREGIQTIMSSILASTKSDIATVGAIKAQRIVWSWIIEKIEEVTAKIDPNFNSGLFEVTGLEIVYSSFIFNSTSNRVGLSGITKTDKSDNFTLITRLIDAFEQSPYFEDVEMRAFTKSGNVEAGFTANFQFDMIIELDGISPKNKPISLVKRSVAKAVGVKRTQ